MQYLLFFREYVYLLGGVLLCFVSCPTANEPHTSTSLPEVIAIQEYRDEPPEPLPQGPQEEEQPGEEERAPIKKPQMQGGKN